MNLFQPCSVQYGDKVARGLKIKCGKCGNETRQHVNSLRSHGDDNVQYERIGKAKFAKLGWKVSNSVGSHRCPECQKAGRAAQMRFLHSQKNGASNVTSIVEFKVDPVKEMSRTDRRVIFAKLEEVYGDEKTGYRTGWTDQKVADDLGTPVAWVRIVREENFGPCQSNPEIDALLIEARAWRTEVANAATTAQSLKNQFDLLMKRFAEIANRGEMVERKLASIEKALGSK